MNDFRVLIIEDDQDISELIESSLNLKLGLNISTHVTTNAEQAFHLSYENQFDLIVTDYKLPGLSGMELIEGLRDHPNYCSTPVIFISGFFKELNTAPNCKKFENVVFVNKPFDVDRLVKNVKFFLLCRAA